MPRYATFDGLDDFSAFYHAEITSALRDDPAIDLDPNGETPTYAWMKANYSGFVERLRRDHDLSLGDFYDRVGIPTDPEEEDAWPVRDDVTSDALEAYVTSLRRDAGRPETTVSSRTSTLRTYVRTYRDLHERDDLVSVLFDPGREARVAEHRRVRATFRRLDDELGTLATKRQYAQVVKGWYDFALEEYGIAVNPARNVLQRMGWNHTPAYDHPALSTGDLDAMLRVGTPDERFLLLALAGWGLRPVEACELHVDQLVLDPDDEDVPYIEFEAGERKNARRTRNTVELLVGHDAIGDRIDVLGDRDGWTGYLLPGQSVDRPMSTQTARNWFRDLGERASVEVDGSHPLPKMGRRTWYRLYRQQRPSIEAGTAAVASAQGSRDADISERNYLDERTRRQARADAMRDLVQAELAGIFHEYL